MRQSRPCTRTRPGKADILNEPMDVLSDNLPSNISNTKAWVAAIRKDLSISKQKQFVEDKKFKKDELQTMATRWGLPFHMASTATPKNLQSIIAVAFAAVTFAEVTTTVDELQAVMQFFQFLISEVPNVSKEVMMWLVGLISFGIPPPKDPPLLVYFKNIEAPCLRMPPFP